MITYPTNKLQKVLLFGGTEQLPETYLDSVTLSGGCEQRNLPEGYTQVEYIETTGTQYISTGIIPTVTKETEIRVTVARTSQTINEGFGSNSNLNIVNRIESGATTTNWRLSGVITNVPIVNDEFVTITLKQTSNGRYYKIKNAEGYSSSNESNYNFYLGSLSGMTSYSFKGKYKACNTYENGTLIQKLIPCRRNSDSVLGMYDTVTGNFLTNAGTGTFTAGPDVVPTPDEPIDIVCNNGVVKVSPNLLDVNNIEGNFLLTDLGQKGNDNSSWFTTNFIKVTPNTEYCFDFISSVDIQYRRICGYSSNDYNSFTELLVKKAKPTDVGTRYTVTFTTSTTTNYIKLSSYIDDINKQIVQGSIATEYMPYGQIYIDGTQEVVTDNVGNTANAERLLAIGNYKDTQEVLSGSVTRRIGIKVLDGTENWQMGQTFYIDNLFAYVISGEIIPYCTHYKGIRSDSTATDYLNTNSIRLYSAGTNRLNIFAVMSDYTNVDEFKAYLAQQYAQGTPVIIVYPLATATTETVTGQFLSKSPVTQTAGSISGLPIAITESSHTVPTPQQPLQINCNNGVVKVSRNLFNISTATRYRCSLAGNADAVSSVQTVSDTSNAQTYGFAVEPNTTYTISKVGGNRLAVAGFTTVTIPSDNPITSVPYTYNGVYAVIDSSATFTTDSDCVWILISVKNNTTSYDDATNIQIEYGSTATPYMPYGQIYTNGTTETVESTGKNLFDKNNTDTSNGYIANAYLDSSGSKVNNNSYNVSVYIPINGNTAYYYAINGNLSDTSHNAPRIAFYNSNKEYISSSVSLGQGKTFTTPANCSYLRLPIYKAALVYDVQLELGSTATTYEPYYNGGSATAENLFKVGDYQDVLSVLDGSVTRNVGIKVLDGSENWVLVSSTSTTYNQYTATSLSAAIGGTSSVGYCTHFNCEFANNVGNFYFKTAETHLIYLITDKSINSATALKQWLADQYNAGTPVIVVYPLAEPTTEQVTPQSLSGSSATITAGSIDDLPIESSTITKLKNRYIGDKEVQRVYIGDNLIFANNDFYGVKINHSTGAVERIGNMEWHRTLPIQSKMRRVSILVDGTVRELSNSNVNDLSADIMVEIPEHYSQTYQAIEDGVTYDYIKLYPYACIGQKVPKHYHGAFKASLNRSTNQLRSIITVDVNNCDITDGTNLSYVTDAATYRGGNNLSEWDSLTKSLLGMPVTYKTIANFATYGTNRGSKYAMLNWAARNVLLRLFIVEYATLHSQADFNPNLDINGYHQGGLGSGVTTLNGSSWSSFNSYYPLIPCGVTYSLGNNTGTVNYTLREVVGGITQVSVPSYRGIESPFGDIWETCNGIYINGANNVNNIYTENNGIYTRNWQYSDLTKYTLKSNTLALREGWITDWIWDSDGDFLPTANTSGASNTEDTLSPLRDYSWGTNTGAKRLMVGGGANDGVRAGLACFHCADAVDGARASSGSRLLRLS